MARRNNQDNAHSAEQYWHRAAIRLIKDSIAGKPNFVSAYNIAEMPGALANGKGKIIHVEEKHSLFYAEALFV